MPTKAGNLLATLSEKTLQVARSHVELVAWQKDPHYAAFGITELDWRLVGRTEARINLELKVRLPRDLLWSLGLHGNCGIKIGISLGLGSAEMLGVWLPHECIRDNLRYEDLADIVTHVTMSPRATSRLNKNGRQCLAERIDAFDAALTGAILSEPAIAAS